MRVTHPLPTTPAPTSAPPKQDPRTRQRRGNNSQTFPRGGGGGVGGGGGGLRARIQRLFMYSSLSLPHFVLAITILCNVYQLLMTQTFSRRTTESYMRTRNLEQELDRAHWAQQQRERPAAAAARTLLKDNLPDTKKQIPINLQINNHVDSEEQENEDDNFDDALDDDEFADEQESEEDEEEDDDEVEGEQGQEEADIGEILRWTWDDDNYERNQLWHGRPARAMTSQFVPSKKTPVTVVLSHCLADLDWLRGYLAGTEIKSLTIVSKCGVQPNAEHVPAGTELITMENIGRIDHTIAHWLAEVLPASNKYVDEDDEEIVVFLKDNIYVHTDAALRSLATLLDISSTEGFACALEPRTGKSFFHLTDMLVHFYMNDYDSFAGRKNSPEQDPHDVVFKSKYENMGEWLDDLGISLPKPLVPVCYGGIFATKRSQIEQVPRKIWRNMEHSLSRGDNIEEGHFAERTWAGLLYRPLTAKETDLLIKRSRNVAYYNSGMRGALMKN